MKSLSDIKNSIIQWFWKLGFGIGKQLGTVGQSLFGDAVREGFETTALGTIHLGSMLTKIKTDLEGDLAKNVQGVAAGLPTDSSELAEMFQGMFAEEHDEAGNMDASEAVFSAWSVTIGEAVTGLTGTVTFNAAADQNAPAATDVHKQYNKDGVSFVIDTTDGSLVVPFVKP